MFNVRTVTVKGILRGHVASDAKNKPATGCENFTARVIIIMAPPGRSGRATRLSLTATRRTLRAGSTSCCSSTGGRARSSRLSPSTSRTATLHLSLSSLRSAVCFYVHGVPPLGRIAVRDMKQTVADAVTKAVSSKQAAATKKTT